MSYLRELSIFPQFTMQLFLDEAIKILHSIPEEHRIGFLDSTGRLCRIPKSIAPWYKKLFNYFFLIKDLRKHNTPKFKSLLLNEMVSSQQDTASISSMLRIVKNNYEQKFKKNLAYRTLVTDYSWASIHAIIESLNNENIITYANKVFHLSKLPDIELENFIHNRTWLTSCASHTMHRFVRSLKPKVKCKDLKEICCYAFSLLLNCTDLISLEGIFKIIVYIFKSQNCTKLYLDSIKKFTQLVQQRPAIGEDVDRLLNSPSYKAFSLFKNEGDNVEEEENEECGNAESLDQNDIDQNLDLFEYDIKHKNFSIKDQSPFNDHFLNIYDICIQEMDKIYHITFRYITC